MFKDTETRNKAKECIKNYLHSCDIYGGPPDPEEIISFVEYFLLDEAELED